MLNHPYHEKNLLLELAKGNEQAFEEIYQLYSLRLMGNLVKLVKSDVQAQEILQEVFLKIWEHRKSIDPEKSFPAFLFKIAENKAYDFFRKVARDKRLEAQLIALSIPDDGSFDEFFLAEEQVSLLQKAIDSLPPQRQHVFRLCKLEGKSYKEVSELLGISVTTINDHIVKGTKSIRQYFADRDGALLVLALVIWSIK